jgi:hypothetical protein
MIFRPSVDQTLYRVQTCRPMGHKNPDWQVIFVGGILLGIVIFGLLIASGQGEIASFLSNWQDLAAGFLTSGVTVIGALLILRQIRSDDERAVKQDRRAIEKLARSVLVALELLVEQLATRLAEIAIYQRIRSAAIAKNDPVEMLLSPLNLEAAYFRNRLADFPNTGALNRYVEDAGTLGRVPAQQLVRLVNDLRRLQSEHEQNRDAVHFWREVEKLNAVGARASRLILLLEKLVDSEGDIQSVDKLSGTTVFRTARDNWEKSRKQARETIALSRALAERSQSR